MAIRADVVAEKYKELVQSAASRYEKQIDKKLGELYREVSFYESLEDFDNDGERSFRVDTPAWSDIAIVLKEKYNKAGWNMEYSSRYSNEDREFGRYHCFTFEARG